MKLKSKPTVLASFSILSLIYLSIVYYFAVNIPNADDFGMYFATILSYFNGDDLLAILIRKHGEHFILTTRLAAIISAKVLGSIDFSFFILIGAIAPILSVIILSKFTKHNPGLILLLCSLLLLNSSYHQVLTWAAASIEHLWVMPFILLALLLDRSPSKYKLLWQVFFSGLAYLTQGNGVFCFAALAIAAFLKRSYKNSIFWLVLLVGGLLIHFRTVEFSATTKQLNFLDSIRYIFSFIGSPFAYSFDASIAIGLFLTLLAAVLFLQSRSTHKPELIGLLVFVLLTAAANAFARGSLGVNYAYTQSRYIYPALFFSIALIILIVDNPQINWRTGFSKFLLSLCFIFSIFSYWKNIPFLELRKQTL
ncbi:MAG: hypothetical protein R3A13_12020, partial [Bdellovibrionota bacterium]